MENFGVPNDEQWSKMKKFLKGDRYQKDDFFVFETQAVGDRIVPNRYTRILPELLDVMKEDAQKGVSLMLNHNWSQIGVQSIPIGKVFDARIGPGTQDGETTALYVSQYILRDDSKVDGYSKNDIINLIESGIMSDTSIGWGTDTDCYTCNICGNQYYSMECRHWRGHKYIINEDTNEVKQCIVEVKAPKNLHAGNNVLMENSIVFDGAYPNAQIQSINGSSTMQNNNIKLIKDLKGEKEILNNQKIYANSFNNRIDLYYIPLEKGGEAMEEKDKMSNIPEADTETEVVETETESVEAEQTQDSQTDATNTEEVQEATPSVETQTDNISFDNSELAEIFGETEVNKEMLLRLVKDGKMYRENVISQALKSGIRSLGNSFNKESFEKTFNLMETEDIKAMGDAWEADVSEKFSTSRVSKDRVPNESNNNSSDVDYSYLKTSTY